MTKGMFIEVKSGVGSHRAIPQDIRQPEGLRGAIRKRAVRRESLGTASTTVSDRKGLLETMS